MNATEQSELAHETFQSAAVNKKRCKNNDAFSYTGKEASPLGLGYTAQAEAIGTVREGRDKTHWIVCVKNAVNVWCRTPTPPKNIQAEAAAEPTPAPAAEAPAAEAGPSKPAVPAVPAVPAPAKKKPTATKKKEPEPAPPKNEEPAPAKKALSSYNLFIKWKISKMTDVKPSERMAVAAKEWKAMTKEEKDGVVARAKEELGL